MKKLLTFVGGILIGSSLMAQLTGQGERAQTVQLNTITTAVPFLMIGPDSRAGGLGEAGLGLSPDANQLHWNPSSLAFGEDKLQISLSYVPWLRDLVPDMNLAYLAAYGKLSKKQAIGGSLRYFSLGDITFTDINGQEIRNFNPNELAVDFTFAQQLADNWSGALSARYIYSNLTGGTNVGGVDSKAGQSFAVDLSMTYQTTKAKLGKKDMDIRAGFNISNIGAKMSYTETADRDFIPTNLRLGSAFTIHLDDYNELTWSINFNKLLVPTPPIYAEDSTGNNIIDSDGNYEILLGMNPDVGPAQGMIQSFYDAPGTPAYDSQGNFTGAEPGSVFGEEISEINFSTGFEYWYAKQFAVRAGYFYEAPTKGNRQFITLGVGVKYNIFTLDFSYLIATTQRNPLANTLRFTLMFTFDDLKANKEQDPADFD
jgi:hypothetical protein